FREAVRGFRAARGDGDGGPRVRPTMEQLVRRVAQVILKEEDVVQDQLSRNGIDLVKGRAAFVDAHVLSVESTTGRRSLSAENILLAVGTRPSEPRGVRPDGQTLILSDNLLDLERLPRTMVVVGGGVIGIEYASMFANLGIQVTVVDKRPRPLEFVDGEIVDELIHQMRKHDVTFRCGDAVESIEISEGPPRRGVVQLRAGQRPLAA